MAQSEVRFNENSLDFEIGRILGNTAWNSLKLYISKHYHLLPMEENKGAYAKALYNILGRGADILISAPKQESNPDQ